MKHTVAVVTHAHVLQNFYTTCVRGVAYQKQRLGPKLEGAWLAQHPKIWDPLCISATFEASNFKFGTQLRFGTCLPKTTFRTKIGGGMGQGSIQRNLGPSSISGVKMIPPPSDKASQTQSRLPRPTTNEV